MTTECASHTNARRTRRFCLPFFSICVTRTAPISLRAHMGAAAGLQVEVGDFDQPHPAGAHRRLHRHGLDQAGIGGELVVADPAAGDGRVGRDHLVHSCGDRVLVEAGFRDVEIEPALALADRAAGHRIGQHRRQQMQRGVHAHAGVTLVPIDRRGHRVAGFEGRRARRRHMRDLGFGRVGIDRIVDRDARAVGRAKRAAVAGLAAGIGVEHRAVEHDAALVGDGEHARLAFLQIAVVAEQAVGRHRIFPLAHDLIRKPVSTFRDHALSTRHERRRDGRLALQPFRHRQIFRAQEGRVEQLGLVTRTVIGEAPSRWCGRGRDPWRGEWRRRH